MRMKKISLVLVAVLCVASVSAQKTKWAAGLRATYGVQAVGEYFYSSDKYAEARFGLYGGAYADLTALHNWNCCNWNWTPSVGKWYLDAGAGLNLGGAKQVVYGGVAGQVKFGIKFNKVPIRLSVDYTPVIGVGGYYLNADQKKVNRELKELGYGPAYAGSAHFYTPGFYNFALSATWHF